MFHKDVKMFRKCTTHHSIQKRLKICDHSTEFQIIKNFNFQLITDLLQIIFYESESIFWTKIYLFENNLNLNLVNRKKRP